MRSYSGFKRCIVKLRFCVQKYLWAGNIATRQCDQCASAFLLLATKGTCAGIKAFCFLEILNRWGWALLKQSETLSSSF